MLVLRNATVVTGDGATVISDGAVVVEGARIVEVRSGSHSRTGGGDTVMDLGGRLIVPGAINSHAHGSVACPLFASGAPPLPFERVLANLDYHLLGGTTTLLNLDGFNLPEEVDRSVRAHPINLRSATIHFPLSFQAANEADGKGLAPAHLAMSVETMLAHGAVAIGKWAAATRSQGGAKTTCTSPWPWNGRPAFASRLTRLRGSSTRCWADGVRWRHTTARAWKLCSRRLASRAG